MCTVPLVAFGLFPLLSLLPSSLPSLLPSSPGSQSSRCPWGCPLQPRDSHAFQELQQLVQRTRQEARAHQQAREHEAERLRIEIVTLREALDEAAAARASLEGQLRVQREETGEGRGNEPSLPCFQGG